MEEKLKQITEGWKNLLFFDKGIEKLAIARAKICSSCKHNKLSICVKCKCIISAKVRALTSVCPISKW